MATVSAHIDTLEKPLPGVAGFSHYDYFLQPDAGTSHSQAVSSTAASISFPQDVPNGQYYVEVFAVDSLGTRMDGGKQSAKFVIPTPTGTTFQSPNVVSVTVA